MAARWGPRNAQGEGCLLVSALQGPVCCGSLSTEVGGEGGGREKQGNASFLLGESVEGGGTPGVPLRCWTSHAQVPRSSVSSLGCSGLGGEGSGYRLRPSPPGTFCYYLPLVPPSHRSMNAASALSWVPSCGPPIPAQVSTFGRLERPHWVLHRELPLGV